jgi:Flp pilus assembly protein TadG
MPTKKRPPEQADSPVATSKRLWRDRRGATGVAFAATAVALLGLVGVGTEGGTWYLEKRHGQNAADAAAFAAMYQIAADNAAGTTPGSDVATGGTTIATANLYTAGSSGGTTTSVTVTPGTYSSRDGFVAAANPPWTAVQAQITRSPPRLLSGLFLASNPTITETATATFLTSPGGPACMLALSGGLTFKGSSVVTTNNCALASDNTGTSSIGFNGSTASVSPPGSLYAAGGCNSRGSGNQCSLASVGFPCVPDPFGGRACGRQPIGIAALTMPPQAASSATCESMPASGTVSASLTFEHSGKMFCTGSFNGTSFTGDIVVGNGITLDLSPGTYILYNASIKVTGGTLECTTCSPGVADAGVTIILTGSPASKIGTISITGNGTVSLNAPKTNDHNAAFDGVLFYMDRNAPNTNGLGNAPVSLTGTGTMNLTGGMYFPSANVTDNGNITSSANCSEIVAYAVTISGNSTQDVSGCASVGTPTPKPYYVALVQ